MQPAREHLSGLYPVIGHPSDGPRPKLPLLLSVCVELRPKSAQSKHATLCHNSAPSPLQSVRDAPGLYPRRGTPPPPPDIYFFHRFLAKYFDLRSSHREASPTCRHAGRMPAAHLLKRNGNRAPHSKFAGFVPDAALTPSERHAPSGSPRCPGVRDRGRSEFAPHPYPRQTSTRRTLPASMAHPL